MTLEGQGVSMDYIQAESWFQTAGKSQEWITRRVKRKMEEFKPHYRKLFCAYDASKNSLWGLCFAVSVLFVLFWYFVLLVLTLLFAFLLNIDSDEQLDMDEFRRFYRACLIARGINKQAANQSVTRWVPHCILLY